MTIAHKKRKQPRETKKLKARECWVHWIKGEPFCVMGHPDTCTTKGCRIVHMREVIVHKKPKAAKGKK